MDPFRNPAEQSEPDPERGPGLDAAPAAPWWALRRRLRWWVRLGSPWARRRREAVRAERRAEAEIDQMVHRTGAPRDRVLALKAMGLLPSQIMERLSAFAEVAQEMKRINPWVDPYTEYAFERRPPRKRWRRTREGRLVRE